MRQLKAPKSPESCIFLCPSPLPGQFPLPQKTFHLLLSRLMAIIKTLVKVVQDTGCVVPPGRGPSSVPQPLLTSVKPTVTLQ